jgi:hypothetical protein
MRSGNTTAMRKVQYTLSLLMFCGVQAFAQTSVGNDEVIIVKEHDSKIKDADKISVAPNIPQLEDQKMNFDYSIPAREYKEMTIEPNPMKPIALSKEKLERFNQSYIKLGFGSQLSPLVEFMYNGKGKNVRYGAEVYHFNATPFSIKNQRFFDTRVGAYVKAFPSTFQFTTEFNFRNYINHFYGNQNTETLTRKQIRQTFQDYDVVATFGSLKKNAPEIDFSTKVQFNYFNELAGKSNEFYLHGGIMVGKKFLKVHSLSGSFDFDISKFKSTRQSLWRNYFLLNLAYGYNDQNWLARGGITLAVEGDKLYPLPDLYLQKKLYEKYVHAFVGWDIKYLKNSYRNFAFDNNFVNSDVELKNTRVSNLYGGFKGTASGFSYLVSAGFKQIANQAFYYNDYFDSKRFYVAYDAKVKVINGHLELGYNMKDDFTALLSLDYNHYTLSANDKAWYHPDFSANLKLRYNLKGKIVVGADILGFTNYYGHVSPTDIRLIKGTADANLSLEYIFNKRFSFFGNLNNIAHQKYQRWGNYPVYGINGLVGAKFAF